MSSAAQAIGLRLISQKRTASESEEDEHVDEEEFDDVDDHSTQRNLQRSQMRADGEDVNRFQETGTGQRRRPPKENGLNLVERPCEGRAHLNI